MTFNHPIIRAAALLFVAGGLAGCGDSGKTAGQNVDEGVAKTRRMATEIKADIKQGAAEVKTAATEATDSAKLAVSDATITGAVNRKLAQDKGLNVMKIDVDTSHGRVALTGPAPDAAAKARATLLASAVDGVSSVDNRLVVK